MSTGGSGRAVHAETKRNVMRLRVKAFFSALQLKCSKSKL